VGKKTGFVSAFKLPHYDSLNKEINYLENAGLVNVKPSPGELLGCLTSKELIKFATEKKIILRSRKKQDLIDTINSNASVLSNIKDKVVIASKPTPKKRGSNGYDTLCL